MSSTYIVFVLNQDNTLSHRENLNDWNEVGEFYGRSYGVHATIVVVEERTDKALILTDNGEWFEVIRKIKNFSEKRLKNTLLLT